MVPEGATIAVESLTNTNGKIPEGDGTAFARGRWTTLELSNDDAGTAAEDTIDLSVSASTDTSSVMVGESRILTFDIGNAVDSEEDAACSEIDERSLHVKELRSFPVVIKSETVL